MIFIILSTNVHANSCYYWPVGEWMNRLHYEWLLNNQEIKTQYKKKLCVVKYNTTIINDKIPISLYCISLYISVFHQLKLITIIIINNIDTNLSIRAVLACLVTCITVTAIWKINTSHSVERLLSDCRNNINTCPAELLQLYFSSFEAGIANAISSFKWRKILPFMKNRHVY